MSEATTLKELAFSDLHLGHPSLGNRFSDVSGANVNPIPAGPALRSEIGQLLDACRDALTRAPHASELRVSHDGVSYRVSVMQAMAGTVFVLRKVASHIESLGELGIPQAYIRQLMTRELSGLLIISGTVKAGKTMTACALVKDRLTAYGGVAVTGEDPIELPLEGCHGQGVCFQTTIPPDRRDFADAFRHLARSGARTILVGEIRDQDTATELLQASISGHLIVTTMLAENVIQTITRLHALANNKLAPGVAQSLIADGLAGVLHQQMVHGAKPKVETEFLFMKDAAVTKTVLRNGKYEMLASEIKQQMASMINRHAPIRRIGEG